MCYNLYMIDNNIDLLKSIKTDESDITSDLNMLKLAYMGDSIYENLIRDYIINKYTDKLKMNDIHKKTTSLVCASTQAKIVDKMIEDGFLNEKEVDIFKSARNSHSMTKSKNSSIVDYRKATGFEAVFGYLYFKNDLVRLKELFQYTCKFIDNLL